jgi:hypothetical protein
MSRSTASSPSGTRRVRRLTTAEIAAYDVVPRELAAKVRIIRLPLPGPYDGITVGRFVFLGRDVDDDGWSTLLAHELVHVRQWSELGVIGFLARYLSQFVVGLVRLRSWNAAYRHIEAELEARAGAAEWRRRR